MKAKKYQMALLFLSARDTSYPRFSCPEISRIPTLLYPLSKQNGVKIVIVHKFLFPRSFPWLGFWKILPVLFGYFSVLGDTNPKLRIEIADE
jgi:hypothetical protein